MDINMENNKKSVIKSLAINEKDTGSSEIQIGLLTQKIDKLSKHFKKSKKVYFFQTFYFANCI